MAEINLSQAEADILIAMRKNRIDDNPWLYPNGGGAIQIPLVSPDRRENFILDIRRGRIDLVKTTLQNRARQTVVLVRLDVNAAPHRNPDGEEIPCPHLHRYRENFGDKWAERLPVNLFSNPADSWTTLNEFMAYCNIVDPPRIQRNLFS